MNTTTAETAWQWITANQETFWEILRLIPLRELLISVIIAVLCGMVVGLAVSAILQKFGLLTRRTKWLNIVVKIYWLFVPAVFVFAAVQIALVRSAWRTADNLVVSNEIIIRNYTGEFLGQIQTHLDTLIEQSPSLKDTSLDKLIDTAIDQTFADQAAQTATTETAAVATTTDTSLVGKALATIKQGARSSYLRAIIKTGLTKAAQKVSGADKPTVEMAFQKTLGEMTDANIVYTFARERLQRLLWNLVTAILLHTLPFLLIPAAEIGLSKWRKW